MERNDESFRLQGTRPVPFRHGLCNSIEMLSQALRLLGTPAEPQFLAGVSGVAFRVYWPDADPDAPGGWDPDAASAMAFDGLPAASLAMGWRLLVYRGMEDPVSWNLALQAVTRDQPVLAFGMTGEPEDGLIVGLERTAGGRRYLVQSRLAEDPIAVGAQDDPRPWPGTKGFSIGLFDRPPRRRPADPTALAARALRRAVWVSRETASRGDVRYLPGVRAYDGWIAAVASPRFAITDIGFPSGASVHPSVSEEALRAAPLLAQRLVLHRTLSAFADARAWACTFLAGIGGVASCGEAPAHFAREGAALREAALLWPPIIEGGWEDARLVPPPAGFHERTWREETVRCLSLAREAYAAAVAEIDRAQPPLPEELEEEARDDEAAAEDD